MYHFSYIQYVFEGQIPKPGDALSTWARDGFSCNPVWPFGMTTKVDCGNYGELKFYPEGGANTAAIWPPNYYILIAAGLKFFSAFGFEQHLQIARYLTAIIWSIGVVVLAKFLIDTKVTRLIVISFALVISSLPFAMFHGAFITPHSMIPLIVGCLLLSSEKLINQGLLRKKSLSFFILTVIFSVLSVPHSVAAVLAVSLTSVAVIQFNKTLNIHPSAEKFLYASLYLISGLLGILISKFWEKIQNLRFTGWSNGIDVSQSQGATLDTENTFSLVDVIDAIWRFIPHSIDGYQFQGVQSFQISQIFSFLLIGALFASIFTNALDPRQRILAINTIMIGIVFSIYLEVVIDVAISARYGLSIAVLGLTFIPAITKTRIGSLIFFSLAVATYVLMIMAVPFRT